METLNEVEILLVEDNPNDAEMAIRAFKKNKLANNIYVARDGEEALNFIFAKGEFSNRIDMSLPKIILLDLQLPKISGLEVLKAIKSNPDTKVIPVVVLTTSKEESDIIQSYQWGVNSYIIKPVDFDKFVDAVRDMGMYWLLLNQSPI